MSELKQRNRRCNEAAAQAAPNDDSEHNYEMSILPFENVESLPTQDEDSFDQVPQAHGRLETSRETAQPDSREDKANFAYRIIKWIALIFIALCILAGTVLSKVSPVSITGRMFNLTRSPNGHTIPRSVLFIQLTLLLVIPDVVSFIRCLVWGVIGKSREKFPWPSRWAFIGVSMHYY